MQSGDKKSTSQRAVRKARANVPLTPANKELPVQAAAFDMKLSECDSLAFTKAVVEPPVPSERARQAARDYLARYHK